MVETYNISELYKARKLRPTDELEIERPGSPNLSLKVTADYFAANTAVQPEDLAPVATSGSYNDLTNQPVLGSAAAANTTDFAANNHTHTFAEILSKPTTLSGYGITDGVPTSRTITAGTGLSGGGALGANRSFQLNANTIASLALANTAVQPEQLGTAAYANTTAFATATQGTLADSAVQPAQITDVVRSADQSVMQIIALTQAEYDLLTPVPTTLYIIKE